MLLQHQKIIAEGLRVYQISRQRIKKHIRTAAKIIVRLRIKEALKNKLADANDKDKIAAVRSVRPQHSAYLIFA